MNSEELLVVETSMWSRISKPFWNRQERRPRAFWRLLLQLFLGATITFVLGIGSSASLREKTIFSAVFSEQNVATLGFVISVWLAARFLDRRPFADLGFQFNKAWWLDVGFGLALGTLIAVGQFLTDWVNGWVTITATFYTAS